jgi:ABC-2 type transport system permease protein
VSAPTEAAIPTAPAPAPARSASLPRLLSSELLWVLRRPRTLVLLGVFALIPVLIAIGVAVGDRSAPGLIGAIAGNGLVLPVAAMTIALGLLLPLAVAMAAADAIAGESAQGTLRGLLVAPVSRLRLVGMKAFGVLVVATLATAVIAVVGVLAGLCVVGTADGHLVTLSGSTLSWTAALARVALVVVWTIGQLAAVGAVSLAISAVTDHPLVVLAAVLGGLIVFGVLSAIPALDWLQPFLLTTGWRAGADALRDPLPWDGMVESSCRAACYLLVGGALTVVCMLRRDA